MQTVHLSNEDSGFRYAYLAEPATNCILYSPVEPHQLSAVNFVRVIRRSLIQPQSQTAVKGYVATTGWPG